MHHPILNYMFAMFIFFRMDSIDVYLAKKRKRTQTLYANMKKAKVSFLVSSFSLQIYQT